MASAERAREGRRGAPAGSGERRRAARESARVDASSGRGAGRTPSAGRARNQAHASRAAAFGAVRLLADILRLSRLRDSAAGPERAPAFGAAGSREPAEIGLVAYDLTPIRRRAGSGRLRPSPGSRPKQRAA